MTKHPVPAAALDSHLGVLGKTGSGKSFTVRALVERLLDDGRRVCILDYTGVWSGLRSSANGKKGAYPVVIFGGEHADVPLTEHAGPAIAKLVAGGNRPCIIDVDGMTVGAQQRFVTAFLEELYRLNSKPLHLVLEEIDEFAPQTGAPGTERMLGAVARIFQRGRRKGFRAIAITQRPANVHKRVLAQCNAMIALRLVAPQDRKAIADWIKGHGDDELGRQVIDSLPKLGRGEGWVWAPEVDVLERVKFPPIKTFDSMRAPADGEVVEPASWAAVDLDAVKTELADAVAEAEANDPKKLKAQVADLSRRLADADKKRPGPAPATPVREPDDQVLRRPAVKAAIAEAAAAGEQRGEVRAHKTLVQRMKAGIGRILSGAAVEAIDEIAGPTPAAPAAPPRTAAQAAVVQTARVITHSIWNAAMNGLAGDQSGGLAAGEKKVLAAIAQYPNGIRREQLTVLTGYKKSSRDTYIQRLRAAAYILVEGDKVIAMPEGIAVLGDDYEPPLFGKALREQVMTRLAEGERKVLEAVIAGHPGAVDRAEIDAATGYKKSSRDTYIQRLRARELVEVLAGGAVKASDNLFHEPR